MEERCKLPTVERTATGELAEKQLHVKEGHANDDESYGIGDEERAPAVPVAQVWEPPDVAQSHCVSGFERLLAEFAD